MSILVSCFNFHSILYRFNDVLYCLNDITSRLNETFVVLFSLFSCFNYFSDKYRKGNVPSGVPLYIIPYIFLCIFYIIYICIAIYLNKILFKPKCRLR